MGDTRGGAHRVLARTIVVALALGVALAARGEAQAPAPKEQKAVTLAIGIDAGFTPHVVAVEKGFTKKYGLDARYKIFESGPAAFEAVLANAAEASQVGEFPPLGPAAKGAKFQMVARVYRSGKIMGISARPEIRKAQDLVGKKVGLIKGSGGEYVWDLYARHHGIAGKVDVVNLGAPEQLPALARGDIQAASHWEPWLSKLPTVVKGGHVLARSGDDGLYYINLGLVFNDQFVRRYPETAAGTLRALIDAGDWINGHVDEASQIVSRVFNISEKDARYQVEMNLPYRLELTDDFVASIVKAANWAKEIGKLDVPSPDRLVRGFIHPELMRKVAAERVTYREER